MSNALYWHLVRLNDDGFIVSERGQLVELEMEDDNLDEEAVEKLAKGWKERCSLMVHVIYNILQRCLPQKSISKQSQI